ncbi:MAG TPA: DUF1326 domain-containing protein [Candidatus Dormibacteraeota bacterium]
MTWRVSGTYFESCNCDAICPCRRTAGADGGSSTDGVCDFALSWWIEKGHYDETQLDGLTTVMVGSYVDKPTWTPWQVALLVDERGSTHAREALAAIFLGKAGGTPMANFTNAIGEVRAIRPAAIRLDHTRGQERIDVGSSVEVWAGDAASDDGEVSCGIPGHDQPGTEVHATLLAVDAFGFEFRYSGVCGFTTKFDYRSD